MLLAQLNDLNEWRPAGLASPPRSPAGVLDERGPAVTWVVFALFVTPAGSPVRAWSPSGRSAPVDGRYARSMRTRPRTRAATDSRWRGACVASWRTFSGLRRPQMADPSPREHPRSVRGLMRVGCRFALRLTLHALRLTLHASRYPAPSARAASAVTPPPSPRRTRSPYGTPRRRPVAAFRLSPTP